MTLCSVAGMDTPKDFFSLAMNALYAADMVSVPSKFNKCAIPPSILCSTVVAPRNPKSCMEIFIVPSIPPVAANFFM
eukprot:472145-Prorocentrum_minimum.AAC.1